MTDSLVNNYSKIVENNFSVFKRLTNILYFDDSNIELNNSIITIIDESIILIDEVNSNQPGFYDENSLIELKNDRAIVLNSEGIINVPIVERMTISQNQVITNKIIIKRTEEDIKFRYSNIPGLSLFGKDEFLNLLLLNDEINMIENPENISDTKITDTYERLKNNLNILKESATINFEEKENEFKITFKLYKLHPYFNECHNITICLVKIENDLVELKENLNKIKEKVLTISLLIKNLKTF